MSKAKRSGSKTKSVARKTQSVARKAKPARPAAKAAPAKAVKGLKPGARFATQAHALARVFREYTLVAKVGGDEFTADEIEQLAAEQAPDEDRDHALFEAWSAFHAPYTQRSNARAKRFAAALKAARGLLAGNATAQKALKEAQFNQGHAAAKKPHSGTKAT